MVPCPQHWTVHPSGAYTVFVLPGSGSAPKGLIRYRERVRPVRRLLEVARSAVLADADFIPATYEPTQTLQTAEGEYAGLVQLDGTYQGKPARRFIGSVFTEDFATELDVLAPHPDGFTNLQQLATNLLVNDTLQLGVRPRRFLYTPPHGWRGQTSGLSAIYYPVEFPQIAAHLTVPPAEPLRRPVLAVYAAITQADAAAGLITEQEFGPDPVSSEHGLRGRQWYTILKTPSRLRQFRYVILFQDEHYTYTLRLHSESQVHLSAQHRILSAVCRSVQPLPVVSTSAARPRVPGGIWID